MQYPLMDWLYKKGKKPHLFHVDVSADTLTNTLAEIAPPANLVADFTSGQQIYIRSSEAADISKSCYVIGQPFNTTVMGSTDFGVYELTTDATDGTTAIDCGLWSFIMYAYKKDTVTGNLVIDDDGSSTTVFWTLTLGATQKLGIIYTPSGYYGSILTAKGYLTAAPANVNASDTILLGDEVGFTLNSYKDNYESSSIPYAHLTPDETQIKIQGYYKGAAETDAMIEAYIVIWEE